MSCDTPLSQEIAKALVEHIAFSYYGYLNGVALQSTAPEFPHQADYDAVLTLAKSLSTSDAQLVFEVLRNADENHFTRAKARNQAPFVTFKVASSYIIVECNEDGFTSENITAICAVSKSSKPGAHGYIGEKGIGFKSVFMAAYKVHIQSENFSFSFNHRSGQSGIGMISPTWEDAQDGPPRGITRIKLFLHHPRSHPTNKSVIQQFEEIQATHLLFLKNIRCINILYITDEGVVTSSTKYSTWKVTANRITVIKERDGGTEGINYHITKHPARNENRANSKTEQAVQSWPSSEVVLAFPLDKSSSNPVVMSQQIFALLPIRNVGFKFLIQADFETQANRRDIVATSGKNQALLDEIAEVFCNAMIQLCADKNLRYTWMRYLPQKNDHPWEGYWKALYDRIKSKIEPTALIRPLSESASYKIEQMRRLPLEAKDGNGDPIFNDILPEIYLSKHYAEVDLDCLEEYGLKWMTLGSIYYEAIRDLANPNSRMKSAMTNDQWHTAAAKLLSLSFERNQEHASDAVRKMEVIPLEDGKWTTAKRPLAFTTTHGFAVPRDLSFTFISSSATKNTARATLFRHLGAEELPVSLVRQLIFNKYPAVVNSLFGNTDQPEEISATHLQFLFLTRNQNTLNTECYGSIAVFTDGKVLRIPLSQDVYISNNHQYGARNLLKSIYNAPGFPVEFISPTYFPGPDCQGQTGAADSWLSFLQTTLGIRAQLRLIDGEGFTDIFRYIMNYRKEEFLGLLQNYWPVISTDISSRLSLREEIADCLVPCGGGHMRLSQTYLPLPDLTECCSRFIGKDLTSFPFLNFENTLAPNDLSDWTFLHDNFDVGISDDVSFYFRILENIEDADRRGGYGQCVPKKVFDLYEAFFVKIVAMDDIEPSRDAVRSIFMSSSRPLILLPIRGSAAERWQKIDRCRWDCPMNMKAFSGLESYYTSVFEEAILKSTIMPFMREVVGVSDLSSDDIIKELYLQKEEKDPDRDIIRQMYKRLAGMIAKLSKADQYDIKERFQTEALIFAAGTWHTAPSCVWSSTTNTPGEVALNTQYPHEKALFINTLGVPMLTLRAAYEELRRKGVMHSATVSEMKQEIWQFNSLLSTAQNKLDPGPILEVAVFPVRWPDGTLRLLSAASSDFAIIDRKELGRTFGLVAKTLDFTLDEVHRLRPFLQWAGLDKRRLSVKVAEVTVLTNSNKTFQESKHSIKPQAYALCRAATHFGSWRAQDPKALHQLLKRSTVFETDVIISELHLVEDDRTLKVYQPQAEVHIDSTDDTLEIYIPKDSRHRDICFLFNLPHALYKWLMGERIPTVETRESEAAKRVITSILSAKPYSLKLLLDREGIVELNFPDDDQNTKDNHSKDSLPVEAIIQQAVNSFEISEGPRPVKPTQFFSGVDSLGTETIVPPVFSPDPFIFRPLGGPSDISTLQALLQSSRASPRLAASSRLTAPITPQSLEKITIPDNPGYVALLDKIIRTARAAKLPRKGPFNVSKIRQALPELDKADTAEDYFNERTAGGAKRYKMMGAAGELYVFELLSTMTPPLPGFSRTLWQSTMREHVSVHPGYRDMKPWFGREKADIMYTDSSGALTAALIDRGYLDAQTWIWRRPTYYIEVKTTSGPREQAFFMSKNQYARMHDLSKIPRGDGLHVPVYVIFRVFNLGKDNMDCALYVNPGVLEAQGALKFTSEKWSVTPVDEQSTT
ncbi:hypothetical protein HD806DRAFT_544090 [Xylariaceae sp. AK1471]|nr:hypothetical protein HD806DRAFT_544090 [Xylariaceae sp. AK1471]